MSDRDPTQESGCCAPSRPHDSSTMRVSSLGQGKGPTAGMVLLDGGVFRMGSDEQDGFPADGEGPVREIELSPFWIEPLAVTNERFAAFVADTGHATDAERYGWSFVFGGLLP